MVTDTRVRNTDPVQESVSRHKKNLGQEIIQVCVWEDRCTRSVVTWDLNYKVELYKFSEVSN